MKTPDSSLVMVKGGRGDVSVLRIWPKEIEVLDNNRFVDLMNRLLMVEGPINRIPYSNIETTVRQYEPDGGIDARVIGASGSRWIPDGLSVWQFKSSDLIPSGIEKEFKKPGVQAAINAGGTYCLVIGKSLTSTKQKSRKEKLDSLFINAGIRPPRYKIYTADHIAEWASQHPSLALGFFGRPIGALVNWERWASNSSFQRPFHADDQRTQIIEDCRRYLRREGDIIHLRITGQTGVGKTRLALEICRERGLQEQVLYADCPGAVPNELWTLLENDLQTYAVVVVDECDHNAADRFSRRAENCNGRVRLLTIGPADRDIRYFPPGFYSLELLPGEVVEKLLKESFPNLPKEAVLYVTQLSSGYVKLAVLMGEVLERHPMVVSTGDLVHTFEIKTFLQNIVTDERERQVMQGLAILTRLGWEGEVSLEGKAVMESMGIGWEEAQNIVGSLVRRGLVAKSGRYRYVTPHLLAVWLASEVWEDRHEDLFRLLITLTTWPTRRALLKRLRDIGDEESARRVCEKLLGPDGLFMTLDDLDSDLAGEIFAILAEAHPQSGLRALERLIAGSHRNKLLGFTSGRRHVVLLLEKLAWLPETFFGAARILLVLAEAENESYANNATGIWIGLYAVNLGGTAVPFFERLAILDEALTSDSLEKQLLALNAIEQALVTDEFRLVQGERQKGRRVPPEWRPAGWEENQKARRAILERLDKVMIISEPKVRDAAERILLESGQNLVRLGLVDELIDLLCKHLIPREHLKYKILDLIETILELDVGFLSQENKQVFTSLREQLSIENFTERLHRWAGKWTWSDTRKIYDKASEKEVENLFISLATEAMANPILLKQEIPWLASNEAENVCHFARYFGELDREWRWWDTIELAVRASKCYSLAGCYLMGQVLAGRIARRNQIMDRWAKDPTMGEALLDAVWRAPVGDGDVYRLIKAVKRGHLQPEKLGVLLFGGWLKGISQVALKDLFTHMFASGISVAAVSTLQMMGQRIRFFSQEIEAWKPLVWDVLARTARLGLKGMDKYYWKDVAQRYVHEDPVKMVEILLCFFDDEAGPIIKQDEVTEVLETATSLAPEQVWKKIGDKLLQNDRGSIRLLVYLKGWYASLVGASILCEWAAKNQPRGPRIVAEIAPVEGVPLSSPARDFIIQFGKQVAPALGSNFLSGTFWGSSVTWLQGKLEIAREWLKDNHPSVRQWAGKIVDMLEKEISREKQREEEEFLD